MKSPFHISFPLLLLLILAFTSCGIFERRVDFDIESGVASKTFKCFAVQADIDILYNEQDLNGIRTSEIKGRMTIDAALHKMIGESGLIFNHDKENQAIAVFYPEKN